MRNPRTGQDHAIDQSGSEHPADELVMLSAMLAEVSANPDASLAHFTAASKPLVLPDSVLSRLGEWICVASAIRDPRRAVYALDAMPRLALTPLEALLAFRVMSEADAVAAISRHLGIAVARNALVIPTRADGASAGIALALDGADQVLAVDAIALAPAQIRRAVAQSGWPPERTVLVTHQQWCEAQAGGGGEQGLLQEAVGGLVRRRPDISAATPTPALQLARLAVLPGLLIGAAFIVPEGMAAIFAALMTLPFLCVVLVRLAALREAFAVDDDNGARDADGIDEAALPSYSVLVPLYREANVLPGLVDALAQLDYPADRLDVILILEQDDTDTQRAAGLIELAPFMRVLLVPPGEPRTKPRALNFALQLARGEIVVIYDAEDIPEPDQIRRAAGMFLTSGPRLACVQCRLNIDNAEAGWLTRQFAIEYTALFDAILPSLHRLGMPIPLGGTSNHFPTALLRTIGAWDPFNVTEDADLGIRLSRAGLETCVLASTTWEEAPVRFGSWYRQRTRWLKGWMQTYLVHTRRLTRLRADLGEWRYRGFQVLMAGMVLSVLLHPLFYALLAYEIATGQVFAKAETPLGLMLLALAAFNLIVGYGSSILLGVVTTWRRNRRDLAWQALTMPFYWLLISAAGYRALWQLFTRPHYWEKTEHGQSRRMTRMRRF